jgi:hypothetical protein
MYLIQIFNQIHLDSLTRFYLYFRLEGVSFSLILKCLLVMHISFSVNSRQMIIVYRVAHIREIESQIETNEDSK